MKELSPNQIERGRRLARIGRKILQLEAQRKRLPVCGHDAVDQQLVLLRQQYRGDLMRAGT